jgi:type VI secretion system protein VasD
MKKGREKNMTAHTTREICRRAGRRAALLLLPLALGACSVFSSSGGAPPQKEPSNLQIAITSDVDLNTDVKGRGAPLLLRVYELKSDVAFQDAQFFALQDNAKAALGADLLAVDQFIIRPGETREIKRKSNPETTAIGVFAGYRDLPNSVWRVVHKLPPAPDASWIRSMIPSNKIALKIDLQAKSVALTDLSAGTRPVQYANESLKGLDGQAPQDAAKKASEAADGPLKSAIDSGREKAKP